MYRDFSHVQRMRVTCEHKHFGRVLDLAAAVPIGKLTVAVITMNTDQGSREVAVAFDLLSYDAQSNLLNLGPCLGEEQSQTPFDSAKIKVTRKQTDAGDDEFGGSVLVSSLASSSLRLQNNGEGSLQGGVLELTSGHVASGTVVGAALCRRQGGGAAGRSAGIADGRNQTVSDAVSA